MSHSRPALPPILGYSQRCPFESRAATRLVAPFSSCTLSVVEVNQRDEREQLWSCLAGRRLVYIYRRSSVAYFCYLSLQATGVSGGGGGGGGEADRVGGPLTEAGPFIGLLFLLRSSYTHSTPSLFYSLMLFLYFIFAGNRRDGREHRDGLHDDDDEDEFELEVHAGGDAMEGL